MPVLFRAAAGPRIGFGHVVRCRSLARALGVRPRVWLRGTTKTRRGARRVGVEIVHDTAELAQRWRLPDVMVLDDPSVTHARRAVAWARRFGVPVVSIHDLGLARVASDLPVDGSVGTTRAGESARGLAGPAYAVLDPATLLWRARRERLVERDRVLIALGGGRHVLSIGGRLAAAISRARPEARIRLACGFARRGALPPVPGAEWITAYQGLGDELARASVAIVAGGVTLYEACAIGVPVVALAVTRTQTETIRCFARHGAAVCAGTAWSPAADERVARAVIRLLGDDRARARLARTGREIVDGQGAYRVAAAVRRVAKPGESRRRAA